MIEPLGKDNYDTWRLHARALLIKTDGWQYVSGTSVKPEPNELNQRRPVEIRAWEQGDQKALADLILSIRPSELKQIKHCRTSREMWNKLEEIYQSKGPARKATMLKKLTRTKMEENDDIKQHLDSFFDVKDKLDEMDVEVNDDLLSIMLLDSLPETFENFRCAMESRDQLPSPEDLKVKILEEFQARNTKKEEIYTSERVMFTSEQKNHEGRRQKLICHRCKKPGHRAAVCRAPKPVTDDEGTDEETNEESYD